MPRYSNLPQNSRGDNTPLYNYIHRTITQETILRRNKLRPLLDDFCTFAWRGIDAFDTFGAFIINKNDLKFYNGPSFSNEYTQPQFESAAGQLTGVKFNTQQITFSIGVYWISIEHYRQLIYWLHPYEINTLSFGFDKNHYYQVKLANLADSTRTIIGQEKVPNFQLELTAREGYLYQDMMDYLSAENDDKYLYLHYPYVTQYNNKIVHIKKGRPTWPSFDGWINANTGYYGVVTTIAPYNIEPRYYTELQLTFEIQGTPCAYNDTEFRFMPAIRSLYESKIEDISFTIPPNDTDADLNSDLEAPIQASFNLAFGLNKNNFRRSDKSNATYYDLGGSEWHFIDTVIGDTSWSSAATHEFDELEFTYKKIIDGQPPVTRTANAISFVTNSAGVVIQIQYDTENYGTDIVYSLNEAQVPVWSDAFQAQTIEFTGSANNRTNSEILMNVLMKNSSLIYYKDMKVNCRLTVEMLADTDENIPALTEKTLFDVTLKNLTWGDPITGAQNVFQLGYDSESGLLYMTSGDSQYFLLNTLSTSPYGLRMVESMTVNTFAIAGRLEDPLFNIKDVVFHFYLTTEAMTAITNTLLYTGTAYVNDYQALNYISTLNMDHTYIALRGRTNLI